VRPSWIGVKLQQITPEIAAGKGMARPEGSIVSWVLPTGPAHKAGLEIGDVVLRFDGNVETDERALLRNIAETPVGDTIILRVKRGDDEMDVQIPTMEWPRNQWDARDAPVAAERPKIVIPPDLGLALAPVPPGEKANLGLEEGLQGVLVTSVAPGSDSANRGMSTGDVILRVQDDAVGSPAEVKAGIDAARAAKHNYILLLVLPKSREVPGPKWVALQLG
jgi:serine protease Do